MTVQVPLGSTAFIVCVPLLLRALITPLVVVMLRVMSMPVSVKLLLRALRWLVTTICGEVQWFVVVVLAPLVTTVCDNVEVPLSVSTRCGSVTTMPLVLVVTSTAPAAADTTVSVALPLRLAAPALPTQFV